MTILQSTGRGAFWFLCLGLSAFSLGLLTWGGPEAFQGMVHLLPDRRIILVCHIVASVSALALMPFQFWKRLRTRRRVLHRWMGRGYAVAVLFGGISGFLLALNAVDPVSVWGFGLLAPVWIGTTALGVAAARSRDFDRHRRWMIRSAALTFAAVTLRLQIPLVLLTGQDFDVWYPVIAWTAWVPNLVVVSLWFRVEDRRRHATRSLLPRGVA